MILSFLIEITLVFLRKNIFLTYHNLDDLCSLLQSEALILMHTNKIINLITLALLFLATFMLPMYSTEPVDIKERLETKDADIPNFQDPVCLLVGLNTNELSYHEISNIAGFETLSVPYRSDIQTLVNQIKATQVIIKHPSGFVGLYTPDGVLIRGVQTTTQAQVTLPPAFTPPSIIQPIQASPIYDQLHYPGSLTGTIPHGGLNASSPSSRKSNNFRHFLKIASLTGLSPFQYPGYFMAYNTYDQENLFSALVLPNVPLAIGGAATFADSVLDQSDYENARVQPRDYKYQPEIEGY